MLYIIYKLILSSRKEQTDTCNMDGLQKHYVKEARVNKDCDFIYMKFNNRLNEFIVIEI